MKLPSKIINYIQQLISLLLYSVRQEVAPHDVLQQRPNSFRYGHQQDSFEYLGYLLDQLHEEERRCLLDAAKLMDNANRQMLNGNVQQKPANQNVNGNDNGNSIYNGNANGNGVIPAEAEQMDIDDNNQLEQTISMDSPPLTDDSDDAINPTPVNSSSDDQQKLSTNKTTTTIVQTMVQKLFGGRLSINYKCLNCNTQSTNIDNFFDLQLSFPSPVPTQPNQLNASTPQPPLIDKTNYTTQSLLNS